MDQVDSLRSGSTRPVRKTIGVAILVGFHKSYIGWIPPWRPAERFPMFWRFRARFVRMSWKMTWKLTGWWDAIHVRFHDPDCGNPQLWVDSVWKLMTICLGFRFLDAPAKTKKARSSFKPLMLCQGVYDGENTCITKINHIKTHQHWTL